MATLADLKSAIATYLGKTTSDFSIDGVDLLLLAINNAKRWAQQMHDFELCRCQASVTVSLSTGGLLSSAVLPGTSTAVDVKQIERANLSWHDTGYKPIRFVDTKTKNFDLDRRLAGWPYRQTLDSPPIDSQNSLGTEDTPQLYQQGDVLKLWPASNAAFSGATSFVVVLDVLEWAPDYVGVTAATVTGGTGITAINTSYHTLGLFNDFPLLLSRIADATGIAYAIWYDLTDTTWVISAASDIGNLNVLNSQQLTTSSPSPAGVYLSTGTFTGTATVTATVSSDFFLTRGFEFLFWRAIVEGNYLWRQFVPRQEGNLSSPDKQLAAAWDALLRWDSSLISQNATSLDLD